VGARLASGGFGWPRGLLLKLFLPLAFRAFAADLRRRGRGGDLGGGHAHHLLGNAVRLALQRIVDRSDRELWLYGTRQRGLRERGWRLRSACPLRREKRNLAEIPRDAGIADDPVEHVRLLDRAATKWSRRKRQALER